MKIKKYFSFCKNVLKSVWRSLSWSPKKYKRQSSWRSLAYFGSGWKSTHRRCSRGQSFLFEYIWKLWTFTSDNCSVTDWWMFKFCYCCWVSFIGDCRESFEHLIRDTKQQIHMQDSLNFVIYVLTLDDDACCWLRMVLVNSNSVESTSIAHGYTNIGATEYQNQNIGERKINAELFLDENNCATNTRCPE